MDRPVLESFLRSHGAEARRGRTYVRGKSEGLWERRDDETLVRLREAVALLRRNLAGPRLTATTIVFAAGLKELTRHLTKSRAFLADSVEARADFLLRRATFAAAKLEGTGRPLTVNALYRETKMGRTDDVTSVFRAVIEGKRGGVPGTEP